MKLRDATQADLKPITELIIECSEKFILPSLSVEGRQNYLQSHSLEKMSERLRQFNYQIFDMNGEIAGVVGMRRPSHLFHLHVLPALHRQGLGTSLWKEAMLRAVQLDQPDKFTVNSSLYAVPFYEKLGFTAGTTENQGGVAYVPMSMAVEQAKQTR